jgi:hypothetical protein
VLEFDNYKKEIRECFQLYLQGPQNLDEKAWIEIKDGYTSGYSFQKEETYTFGTSGVVTTLPMYQVMAP